MQEPAQQSIDGIDIIGDWTIDSTSILVSDCFHLSLSLASMVVAPFSQVHAHKSVCWLVTVDHWAIDGALSLVRVALAFQLVFEFHTPRRQLHFNLLTGTIPSTIGRLSALNSLYGASRPRLIVSER